MTLFVKHSSHIFATVCQDEHWRSFTDRFMSVQNHAVLIVQGRLRKIDDFMDMNCIETIVTLEQTRLDSPTQFPTQHGGAANKERKPGGVWLGDWDILV